MPRRPKPGHRRGREDEDRGVADHDGQPPARGQDPGKVVGELLGERSGDEERLRRTSFDLAGHSHPLAHDRVEVERAAAALLVDGDRPRGGQLDVGRRGPAVAASARGRVQHLERGDGRLDDFIERVGDHAAGGHDQRVADPRRGASEAVDGAVDEHDAGAVASQSADGLGDLRERASGR